MQQAMECYFTAGQDFLDLRNRLKIGDVRKLLPESRGQPGFKSSSYPFTVPRWCGDVCRGDDCVASVCWGPFERLNSRRRFPAEDDLTSLATFISPVWLAGLRCRSR